MPLKRSQFIDKVPWWLAALVAVAYSEMSVGLMRRGAVMQTVYRCNLAVVAFIICCSVGAAGPADATDTQTVGADRQSTNLTCVNPADCEVTWRGTGK